MNRQNTSQLRFLLIAKKIFLDCRLIELGEIAVFAMSHKNALFQPRNKHFIIDHNFWKMQKLFYIHNAETCFFFFETDGRTHNVYVA